MTHRLAPLLMAALLTTFLGSHAVLASPRHAGRTSQESAAPPFVRFLPKVWTTLKKSWEKLGSSLDPFGNPEPTNNLPPPPPPALLDAGSSLDPFGNPKPTA